MSNDNDAFCHRATAAGTERAGGGRPDGLMGCLAENARQSHDLVFTGPNYLPAGRSISGRNSIDGPFNLRKMRTIPD
jgi:hypothetical protein